MASTSPPPIPKIPTPLDVVGLRAKRLAPLLAEQVCIIVRSMELGETSCPTIDGYSSISDELRARMHAAGWALGTTSGRNQLDLTWSALPAADERRVAAEADGVLALAGQFREAYDANNQSWLEVARVAAELLTRGS